MVHRIALAHPAAAKGNHGQPNRPHIHALNHPRRRRLHLHRHRCRWQVPGRRLEEIRGTAQLSDHRREALRRRAGVQSALRGGSGGRGIRRHAPEHQQLRAQCKRHVAKTLVERLLRSAHRSDSPHLHRIPRRPPQHPIHIRQERRRRQPVPLGHLDDRLGELSCALHRRHERARTPPSRPSRARPGPRPASSTGSRRRSGGSTRPCRWRRGSRRGGGRPGPARAVWPTMAQPGACDGAPERVGVGGGVVARDGLELVERAAGVAQARGRRSSAPRPRRPPRSARAGGSPCRPRRRSSACRARGRAGRRRTSRARRPSGSWRR